MATLTKNVKLTKKDKLYAIAHAEEDALRLKKHKKAIENIKHILDGQMMNVTSLQGKSRKSAPYMILFDDKKELNIFDDRVPGRHDFQYELNCGVTTFKIGSAREFFYAKLRADFAIDEDRQILGLRIKASYVRFDSAYVKKSESAPIVNLVMEYDHEEKKFVSDFDSASFSETSPESVNRYVAGVTAMNKIVRGRVKALKQAIVNIPLLHSDIISENQGLI